MPLLQNEPNFAGRRKLAAEMTPTTLRDVYVESPALLRGGDASPPAGVIFLCG